MSLAKNFGSLFSVSLTKWSTFINCLYLYICMFFFSGKLVAVVLIVIVKDICSLRSQKILKGAKEWQRRETLGFLGTVNIYQYNI